MLEAQHDASHIDRHHLLPLLHRGIEEGLEPEQASVRDHLTNRAERIHAVRQAPNRYMILTMSSPPSSLTVV